MASLCYATADRKSSVVSLFPSEFTYHMCSEFSWIGIVKGRTWIGNTIYSLFSHKPELDQDYCKILGASNPLHEIGLKMGNLFMRLIAAAFLFIYLAFSNDWTWIGNVWLLCISTGCWKFQQGLINSIFVHILCCLYMEVRTIKKYGSTFRVAQQQIAVVVWIL